MEVVLAVVIFALRFATLVMPSCTLVEVVGAVWPLM